MTALLYHHPPNHDLLSCNIDSKCSVAVFPLFIFAVSKNDVFLENKQNVQFKRE